MGKIKIDPMEKCPCCSGKAYSICCQKYHKGALAEDALLLMRSRYAAYALAVTSYVIETTHPQSPYKVSDKQKWIRELTLYSTQVAFEGLEILKVELKEKESFVTFYAKLKKDSKDLSFTERSRFLKEGQSWLYVDGWIVPGRQVDLKK